MEHSTENLKTKNSTRAALISGIQPNPYNYWLITPKNYLVEWYNG